MFQSRAHQLVLLFQQLAFGKHHHLQATLLHPLPVQLLQGALHTRQRSGRHIAQRLAHAHQFCQHGGRYAVLAHAQRRFHQRYGKRLAAIAQLLHIGTLGAEEGCRCLLCATPWCQHLAQAVLHLFKMALTVPQGVIGIQGYQAHLATYHRCRALGGLPRLTLPCHRYCACLWG